MLTNVTLSDNIAADHGSGIFNGSYVPPVPSGAVSLKDTIVANDSAVGNCNGTISSLGHNLSSDDSCGLTAGGDVSNADPTLGPLQDNGGPTFTQALLPGSPAIDAGSPDCPPLATDQRGVNRPQDAGCDIGAYEVVPPMCAGDCDENGLVTVDELVHGVNIALGNLPPDQCPSFDTNGDHHVSVDELVTAVHNALDGCEVR